MALRRGFKSEAERISAGVREGMGVGLDQFVDPRQIADFLGVKVVPGDALIPKGRFSELDDLQEGVFSACTLQPSEGQTVIVYSPLSFPTRQMSDIAHELAHIMLNHELTRVERLGDTTFLSCDPIQEEEAQWLSGCLLLPRTLLSAASRAGATASGIAHRYSVSGDLARYRLNVTGLSGRRTSSRTQSEGVTAQIAKRRPVARRRSTST